MKERGMGVQPVIPFDQHSVDDVEVAGGRNRRAAPAPGDSTAVRWLVTWG